MQINPKLNSKPFDYLYKKNSASCSSICKIFTDSFQGKINLSLTVRRFFIISIHFEKFAFLAGFHTKKSQFSCTFKFKRTVLPRRGSRGGEMGEFSPPPPSLFFLSPFLSFFLSFFLSLFLSLKYLNQLWFYYIITKIQNPGSAPASTCSIFFILVLKFRYNIHLQKAARRFFDF